MANLKILVIGEHRGGKLKKTTHEVASFCSAAGNEVSVALIGQGVQGLAAELGASGVKNVYVVEDAVVQNYSADAYTAAVEALVAKFPQDVILTSHTPTGRDFMPKLANRLKVGLASDCVSLAFEGGGIKVRRPVYAGKATAEVEFLGTGPKLATIRANALGPTKPTAAGAAVQAVAVSFAGLKAKTVDVVQGQSARPDVTEASIVVSGGRSVKSADGFKMIEELADTLGAAVGASRAAVDAGYRPHRDQVGQTGKVVSPQLYIACGISGAIQHLAGMRTSKVIVAINTDPEAPIFQVADYGIVGDIFQVVPALKDQIKKMKE